MRSIRKLAPKPSDAIRAMINGLVNQSKREDFKITMSTFGDAEAGKCFGCAATCALQEISQVNMQAESIGTLTGRADATGFSKGEVDRFEDAIDRFRRGKPLDLIRNFYGYKDYRIPPEFLGPVFSDVTDWFMVSDPGDPRYWEKEVGKIEKYIKHLKEMGL